MKPYITKGMVEIITATDNYRNIHGVPDEVVERMRENWGDF